MILDKIKKIYNYIISKEIIVCSCVFAIIITISYLIGVGCPTRFLTGISCPGCGMTRAVIHVAKLDFKTAFYYHPLVFTLPIILILFIYKDKINKIFLNTVLVIIIILFFGVYIVRLLDPSNDVIYASLEKSAIYKLLKYKFLGG